MKPDWQYVTSDTQRLEVPGGWLYRSLKTFNEAEWGVMSMTFVPNPLEQK